jgi:hypothetical protein
MMCIILFLDIRVVRESIFTLGLDLFMYLHGVIGQVVSLV